MFCPNCGKEIPEGSKFCSYCGFKLFNGKIEDENILSESEKRKKIYDEQLLKAKAAQKAQINLKNPSLAVILSFFFMGLGQIYNGQIGKGILFIILYAISIALCWVIIGFITTPILWIIGMIDAYNTAKKINEREVSL